MGQPTILLIKAIYYPVLAAVGIPGNGSNTNPVLTLLRVDNHIEWSKMLSTGTSISISIDHWNIISLLSFTANLVTIVILCRGNCGLSKCISVYMVAMATADLLVMLINVMVYRIFSSHLPFSFLSHTPMCRVILYMTTVTFDLSVWFTVSFTFDRFVALCYHKFKTRYWTVRPAAVFITTFSVLSCMKNIPFLFAYGPQQIINEVLWGCQSRGAFFHSPFGAAFVWFHSAWVVWLPFTLIVLFNSLTVRRIFMANRARRELRGHRSENHSDPEMENRRKSIILLFTVSSTFILLWLTAAVSFVTTRLANTTYYRGDRTAPGYIAMETGALLKFLSSIQNPCIYAATQRKFRAELKNAMKSPLTLILRLVRNCRYEESSQTKTST